MIGPECRPQQREPVDLRHVEVHQHHVEGAPLQQVQRVLTAAAHRDVVPFVPQHAGAALAQRMLVIHDEYPHARPGVRPDCQQGGQLAPVTRLGAVLGHRHGHRSRPGKRLPPSYARFGPHCRAPAAPRFFRMKWARTPCPGHRERGPGSHQGASHDRTACTDLRHGDAVYQPGLHRAGRRGGLDAYRYYYLRGCEAMDEDCGSQRVLV